MKLDSLIVRKTPCHEAQKENIESLLSAVNNSSEHVRNFYITLLLAGTYISIIIWSTNDVMLLKETPVTLPLLKVKLPISEFYAFAPYFYLLLHFNLLLQLSLLTDKLHRFDAAVSKLKKKIQADYYTRLFPFVFTHTLNGHQHSVFLKFMLITMVWITIILLPLGLLLGLQIGFLAYHDEQVLYFQRWAIIIDVLLLTAFWPMIRSPDGKWYTWIRCGSGLPALFAKIAQRQDNPANFSWFMVLEDIFSFFTLLAVIFFSLGVAVLPDSDNEKKVTQLVSFVGIGSWLSIQPLRSNGDHYLRLTEWLFDRTYIRSITGEIIIEKDSIFHRNLQIREKLLIATELKPEDQRALSDKDESIRNLALQKVVGLTLQGRSLRYADFTKSLMPKVDFRKKNGNVSDLTDANFNNVMLANAIMPQAQLIRTNFEDAQLYNADLRKAKLQGANLNGTKLQGADLKEANLQDSNLIEAQLQNAKLRKTNLQGADLREANLQGANLRKANLQGVDLSGAELQCADLSGANLQGANLSEAELQCADLRKANLQGADLRKANLQGADLRKANLQGADLRKANLQSIDFGKVNLTLSFLTGATFGKMPYQISTDLLKIISPIIKDPIQLNKLQNRLSTALERNINLEKAQGQDIWVTDPSKIVLKAFKESEGKLKTAKSESDYQNSLTAFLIKLSCKNTWVASEIINNHIISNPLIFSFAQCLLALKNKTNNFNLPVCMGVRELSKWELLRINKMASQKSSKNNIIPSFNCEAGIYY